MAGDRMLIASVADVGGLDAQTRAAMYALFKDHYEATSAERFAADLAAKQRVVMLRDGGGVLRGFSTLAVEPCIQAGRRLVVIFSGDTIIEPAHWGSPAFAQAWVREIGRIAAQAPEATLYWLLIVKGHRTYRFLPTFGLTFVPDWRQPDDPGLVALRDALARARFGADYDATRGVVAHATSRGHLAAGLARPTPRELARADVRFFLERNPGYARGEELVCLCALSPDNMRPLTLRLFKAGQRAALAGGVDG